MSIHLAKDIACRHQYVCTVTPAGEILECPRLPPLLKALREVTGCQYKIPHGNKVRTLILEQGVCHIDCGETQYNITIKRW